MQRHSSHDKTWDHVIRHTTLSEDAAKQCRGKGCECPCHRKPKKWEYVVVAIFLFLLFGGIFAIATASDTGTVGRTYPIIEENLIDVLKDKATENSEVILAFNEHFKEHLEAKLDDPLPVYFLPEATENRVWYFDPSVTVASDVEGDNGRLYAAKGDVVNPLTFVKLRTPLLFINGREPAHLAWAKRQVKRNGRSRVILINGNPLTVGEELGFRVYIDQHAILKERFGLEAVPSRVTQSGQQLKIEEVLL